MTALVAVAVAPRPAVADPALEATVAAGANAASYRHDRGLGAALGLGAGLVVAPTATLGLDVVVAGNNEPDGVGMTLEYRSVELHATAARRFGRVTIALGIGPVRRDRTRTDDTGSPPFQEDRSWSFGMRLSASVAVLELSQGALEIVGALDRTSITTAVLSENTDATTSLFLGIGYRFAGGPR